MSLGVGPHYKRALWAVLAAYLALYTLKLVADKLAPAYVPPRVNEPLALRTPGR